MATENLFFQGELKTEENNILIIGPDLVVTADDLSWNKAAVKPGDTVTFKALIRNSGTDKATNFKVRFFLNETQIYEKTVTSLIKNSKTTLSKSYKIPSTWVGGQLFQVIVDPEKNVTELNEQNNQAEKKFEVLEADKPDLSVVSTDLSSTPKSVMGGDKINLKAVVKNIGLAAAKNFKVKFFFNGVAIYEKTYTNISKNGRVVATYTYILPANMNGAQIFKVTVDADNKIVESNEKNNEAETLINVVKAGRDLFIESLKPSPTKPKVGQQVSWKITVRNSGNAKANNIKVNFYGDNTSSNPTASLVIPNIAKNISTMKIVKWTVPANVSPAVNYTVRASVDPDNTIDETNETNNIKTASINLTAPDLKIEKGINGYTSGPHYNGVYLAQWGKVFNDNVAPVNNVKVALYYYTGSSSANPVKIAEENLGTLGKKAAREVYLQGTLPANLPLGTVVHVLMKVDYNNEIVETNEDNNVLAARRTVTEKPRTVQYPYLRIMVNNENGDPQNGVTVKLTNTATGGVETKTTGSEAFYSSLGNVIFESRPDTANYLVEVSLAGYRTVTETYAFDKNVEATQERTINLDKKALVNGIITGPNGAPLSWARVRVEGTGLEALTDSQGKYGFLLNGGTYTFRFIKEGYARLEETNKVIEPLSNVTLNKQMSPATVGYISGTATDDEGNPLSNVDVWVNGNLIRVTGSEGKFNFTSSAGTKNFKFKRPNYVTVEFNQSIVAGEEYDFSFTMYKPTTDNHTERGTTFVSWHQHEGTPANAFFIPEYNVDVWWGIGNVKMGLDYTKTDNNTKLTKLTIQVKGDNWECHKVEGEGEVETSAIDIPLTIAAGGCANKKTQLDVYKVAIVSDNVEVWSDDSFWTSASDPLNVTVKTFSLNNLSVAWNNNFKIKLWVRVQKKGVVGTEGDGAGALAGYHLDKKLVTWYPQKPATTKFKTSWGQIGGYFLGILDNPVNAVASFTDLFTVEQFNQYTMEEVLPQNFPGYTSN